MATTEMTAIDRVRGAVRELSRKGAPMTQERVRQYLMQRDGRACSERDVWQALSEYRKAQGPHVSRAVRDARKAIARIMRTLDADTQQRVALELSQVGRTAHEWMGWARPSSRRRA